MNRFIQLFALILILILTVLVFIPKPKKNIDFLNSFWSNKYHATNTFDIVACGDSRIFRGLSSDLISPKRRNLSFLNFGFSSIGLSNDYLNLSLSKFNPLTKNKVLIVGVTPHSLTDEAFKNLILEEYNEIKLFDQFIYRYFSSISKLIYRIKPTELLNFKKNNYLERYNSDGWVASDKIIKDSTWALKSYRKTFNKYGVHHKEMASFLESINRIANSGIHVIAFRPPSTLQMEILEDSTSGFDENFIKENLDSSVIWMDFNNADFNSYDGSHLTEKSAVKFSKMIMQEIESIYKKSLILSQHPNSSSQ